MSEYSDECLADKHGHLCGDGACGCPCHDTELEEDIE